MKKNRVGNTDISVSEIGLGCWTLGGLNWENGKIANGWAPVDDTEAIEAVHYALENGVNHFDNADVYGNGRAERLLAKALGDKSSDVVISSKVGWFAGTAEHAYLPSNIRSQCEQSLVNLKRDTIDLYYFHHGDFGENDCYLDDAVDMMNRLKDEGKIRAIGLSAYSERDFKRLVPIVKPSVLQSWANITDSHFIAKNSTVINLCEEFDLSFIAFSPLDQGILLNKYSGKNPPRFEDGDHRANSEKFSAEALLEVEKSLNLLGERFGNTTEEYARVALQFILFHDRVASAIPGFRNIDQVKTNLSASGRPLNGEEMAFIRKSFA